jgi:prepilin-type N-terminal cleavage/methylation domain-containing protein
MYSKKQKKSGFTLIELSIVLVIIGLIAGGVLVGRDLIHAAQIRAQATQIELYKTAVNAFRIKYNQIPGDMTASSAAAFGFTSRQGTAYNGDGNGIITNCAGDVGLSDNIGCEFTLFWNDLSSAGMINNSFNTAVNDGVSNAITATTSQIDKYFPKGKINDNHYIVASYVNYQNRFIITSFTNITITAGTPSDTIPRSLTPMEAWNLDQKIDDGLPMTGKVLGSNINLANSPAPFGTAAACFTDEDTPNTYNVKRAEDRDVVSCNQWYFW